MSAGVDCSVYLNTCASAALQGQIFLLFTPQHVLKDLVTGLVVKLEDLNHIS